MAATPAAARVVALTGDLDRACRAGEIRSRLADFTVVEQRGVDDFADRLANAHVDASAAGIGPVLQIGMDTPQVTPELLTMCARALLGVPVVLGMAADGGWWALGLRDPRAAAAIAGVPTSRDDTGERTAHALRGGAAGGTCCRSSPTSTRRPTRAVVARLAPGTRFAAAVAGLPALSADPPSAVGSARC